MCFDGSTGSKPLIKTPGAYVFKNLMCLSNVTVAFQRTKKLRVADIQCCPFPVIKQKKKTDQRQHPQTSAGLDG